MKGSFLVVFTVAALLTACGTIGGAVSGAGQDLTKAGDWIKSK
jgi:predicted small secreted protein